TTTLMPSTENLTRPSHFHICGRCDRRFPGFAEPCKEPCVTLCSVCLTVAFPKAKILPEQQLPNKSSDAERDAGNSPSSIKATVLTTSLQSRFLAQNSDGPRDNKVIWFPPDSKQATTE